MAWVEFHGARIKRLKKFSDFRRSLQWSVNEALGFLGSFWCEVMELCENGDISGWTPEYVCDLTGLSLSPERVWNALVTNNWIDVTSDGRFLIHDWLDYAGRFLRNKYASSESGKEYLKDVWRLHGRDYGNSDATQMQPKYNRSTSTPNLTKPYQKELSNSNQGELLKQAVAVFDLESSFEAVWKEYPAKDGKKKALVCYKATVKGVEGEQRVRKALKNYKAHLARQHWKQPKNGSTWFNNWEDWVDWKEPAKADARIAELINDLRKKLDGKPGKSAETVISKLESGTWGFEDYQKYLAIKSEAEDLYRYWAASGADEDKQKFSEVRKKLKGMLGDVAEGN